MKPLRRRRLLWGAAAAIALLCAMWWPESIPPTAGAAQPQPFAWKADSLWSALEKTFVRARGQGCPAVSSQIEAAQRTAQGLLARLATGPHPPRDPVFPALEHALFELAAITASCPEHAAATLQLTTEVRSVLKEQTRHWDLQQPSARRQAYRLMYGARAAAEELLLQLPAGGRPAIDHFAPVRSETPSVRVRGVQVHSGDLLVSRGGAPTSALIARGNDYPGNFSHVALLHVSEDGAPSVIESHIESGVGVSDARTYLADKKLRILVLRPRPELPALRKDPLLPHRVATRALAEAKTRHIPYDFAMNHRDPSKQFCSEVASANYARVGLRLWPPGLSSMSQPGTRRWLAGFGVTQFETLAPSDLEYDPQLQPVAEWRDQKTLFDDHVDNAVIDAMLERADQGGRVGYSWPALPLVRLAKGWSMLLNVLGRVGPVPEGMSATVALRVRRLEARHQAIRADLVRRVEQFRGRHGYTPPYWALVRLAKQARRHSDPGP